MTEKNGNMEIERAPRRARYAIDPLPFFIALITAPFAVALCTFWALFIPVFAIVFGGPIYLLVGTPVLLIYLHYRSGDAMEIAGLAFLSQGTVIALVALYFNATGNRQEIPEMMGFGVISLIMAPLWGMAFGWIYSRLRSDASRNVLPHFAQV
ncbi:hypothetical protein KUV51_01085 [Tateyamaria omphalii]|uniref:hypothetical protein n=1 Tax=Tateyamaria omphalii TaxID=299262 RepID=UPI001C996B45|nr:hypothetical protein [Tateyamaria omphalii]MBY5931576.1 hypothetical protein [Tateyamaria omphalii]